MICVILYLQGRGTILFSFYYGRIFYTLPCFLGVASALSTFFFWLQSSIAVDKALDYEKFLAPPKWFKAAAVLLSLLMVFVDLYITFLTVNGSLPGNITTVPAIALIVFNTLTAIAILLVSLFFSFLEYLL
jgi:hypothetical protein